MSPSDHPHPNSPPQNLNFLYQRHRSRVQDIQHLGRAKNTVGHDRQEAYAEKFARMYPRELRQTGPSGYRYISPSSPHSVTSPLLSALGTTTHNNNNNSAQYTSDWTKSLPYFTSGGGGLVAESPPNGIPIGSQRDVLSASPPYVKPQSQPTHGLPSLSPRITPHRERRASLYSQTENHNLYRAQAPLPHEDQPHFHPGGLIDLESIGSPQPPFNGLMPGEKGYFCGWDSFADAGHMPSNSAENVIIAGYEGGVNIYRATRKDKPVLIGYLRGLRGAVLDAKILPWTSSFDPGKGGRPYIAIVIHGPMIEDNSEPQHSSDESAAISNDDESHTSSTRPASRQGRYIAPDELIKSYRTTVEIYSLQTSSHVETIFATPAVPFKMPLSPFSEFVIPPPVGDLRLDAQGKFLVVASGESGELFVYSPSSKRKSNKLESMRCIGKLWTKIEKRKARRPSSGADLPKLDASSEEIERQCGVPLFSLSHRFLAIVPPSETSPYSINGVAHISTSGRRPPGLANHTAPPSASATCEIDSGGTEDLMDRLSREFTQTAVTVSNFAKDKVTEAWRSWNTNSLPQPVRRQENSPFPPTHGFAGQATHATSAQVAIFDLQRFLDAEDTKIKNVLTPLASFELASGCAQLSFAPTGLHLLTISRKGDQAHIWCLLKMKDSKPGHPMSHIKPTVRCISYVKRHTITKIIDVVWAQPHGQRFGLLSENNTVHIHEIPSSAFHWPPYRRIKRGLPKQRSQSQDARSTNTGYGGYALNAINGVRGYASNFRQRSLSGQVTLGGLAMTPANFSRKAIRAGLKQGASALAQGAYNLYHVQDNKLNLKSELDVLRPRSIRLLSGRSFRGSLGVLAAGTVHVYQVRTVASTHTSGPTEYRAKISKKGVSFNLDAIPSDQFAPAVRAILESRTGASTIPDEVTQVSGRWTLRLPQTIATTKTQNQLQSSDWRKQFELDTLPAFHAFHTDRRVSLFALPDPEQPAPPIPGFSSPPEAFEQYYADRHLYEEEILHPHIAHTHHLGDTEPWVFGEELSGARLIREGASDITTGDLDDTELQYNVVKLDDGSGTLVLNTVPRSLNAEEEFFEADVDIVEFAEGIGRA